MSEIAGASHRGGKTRAAYEMLKGLILSNTLAPGTPLAERALCARLNVSRTPLRDALRRLEYEELVSVIPGKGAFVSHITHENVEEIYDIREVMEGLAARLFIENAEPGWVAELETLYEQFIRAVERGDFDEAVRRDIEFHDHIIDRSRSTKLKTVIRAVLNQSVRITMLTRHDYRRADSTRDQHGRILEAFRAGDARLAETRMREHIRDSRDYHLKNLKRYRPG